MHTGLAQDVGCPMYPEDVACRNLWAYASGLCEPLIYKSHLLSHLRFSLQSHSLHTAEMLWYCVYTHIKPQRPNQRLQPNHGALSVRLVWYCRRLPIFVVLPLVPLLCNMLDPQRCILTEYSQMSNIPLGWNNEKQMVIELIFHFCVE